MTDEPQAKAPVLRGKPKTPDPATGNGTAPEPLRAEPPKDYVDPEWAAITTPEKCGLYLFKTRKTLAEVTGDPSFMPTRETVQVGGPMLSLGLRHSRSEVILQMVRRSPMIAVAVVVLVLAIVIGIPLYTWNRKRQVQARYDRPAPQEMEEPEVPEQTQRRAQNVDYSGKHLARGVVVAQGFADGRTLGFERQVGG